MLFLCESELEKFERHSFLLVTESLSFISHADADADADDVNNKQKNKERRVFDAVIRARNKPITISFRYFIY